MKPVQSMEELRSYLAEERPMVRYSAFVAPGTAYRHTIDRVSPPVAVLVISPEDFDIIEQGAVEC